MASFFELSGIVPTEMEFIEEKVRALMRTVKNHESASLLKEVVALASKDKISARDAALEGFVVGGLFIVEQMLRREQMAMKAIAAELAIPEEEEHDDEDYSDEPAMNEGYL